MILQRVTLEVYGATCHFPSLDPQQSAVMTITADAPTVPTMAQCAPVENFSYFLYVSATTFSATSLADVVPPWTNVYSNTVTTQVDCQPGIEIAKNSTIDVGDNNRVDAGEVVTYTIQVANSGNMVLYDIKVTDDMPGIDWQNDLALDELGPGETADFVGTYEVTQAEIDGGQLVNSASVQASLVPEGDEEPNADPSMAARSTEGGTPMISASVSNSVEQVTALQHEPAISLTKSSSGNGDLSLDETITYTFTIINIGNVTLTSLELIDDMEGVEFAGEIFTDSLAPGETIELGATYVVTQADIDHGLIVNCADVTAISPRESAVSDTNKCATDLIEQNPALEIAYACQGPTDEFLPAVGEDVSFDLTITNNGDQTLYEITVDASRSGTLDADLPMSLAPGETVTRTWSTVVSESDMTDREVRVDVTVTGQTESGLAATLASTVAVQSEISISASVVLECEMGQPAVKEPVQMVTKLPDTGSGGVAGLTPIWWTAAIASALILVNGTLGVRRRR